MLRSALALLAAGGLAMAAPNCPPANGPVINTPPNCQLVIPDNLVPNNLAALTNIYLLQVYLRSLAYSSCPICVDSRFEA